MIDWHQNPYFLFLFFYPQKSLKLYGSKKLKRKRLEYVIEVAEDTELKNGLSNDFLKEDAYNFFTDDDLIYIGKRQIHFMYTDLITK